jgi:hypothetical protein
LSEDPVSEASLEAIDDYLEVLAEKIDDEATRKRIRPSHLFSAMQQQHLIGKLLKGREEIQKRTVIEEKDMLRTCQLGYEGLDEFREEAIDKFDELDKNITLEKYEAVLAPLGNFILGSKTLKEYCPTYLLPKQIGKIGRNYSIMKQKVADIDEETDKIIEDEYTPSLQKDYGVVPRKKGDKQTIFNIEGQPLYDIDNFLIIDIIKKYEQQTGKKALWRNARTKPFLKFLSAYITEK